MLPQMSAGAIFQIGMATGKFQGVMIPTTPSGTRFVYCRTCGALYGMTLPMARVPSPA